MAILNTARAAMKLNQTGVAHILLLLAALGLIAFLIFSSTGEFQDRLFATLYPKSSSFAASTSQLGTLSLTASGSGILVNLPIGGDDNNNASVTLEYKKSTDTTWTPGPTLTKSAVQGVNTAPGDVKAATAGDTVPDAIIVKFKKEIPEEDRKALSSKFNLTFDSSIQSKDTEQVTEDAPEATNIFNRLFRAVIPNRVDKPKLDIIRFKVNPANRDRILAQLKANPLVEYAELEVLGQSLYTPNDPLYPANQWDLPEINALAAWDINPGNPAVVIGVIDTGVDTTLPDFAGQLVTGYDVINNTTAMTDCSGHGTAVIGRVGAATNNGLGIASLGSRVKVMPIRDSNHCIKAASFGVYDLAKALIHAADNGLKIVSISQGVGGDNSTVKDAVIYAQNKGVLIVAAAGNRFHAKNNDGSYAYKADGSVLYTGCLNGETGVMYPAAYPNVIAVGATRQGGGIWEGSCPGPQVKVAAPGAGVYTMKKPESPSYSLYGSATGTSFAAPQVAALAALILSVNPNLTRQEVTNIILGSATDMGAIGRDDNYGYGRINALKALQQAQGGIVPTATPASTSLPTTTPSLLPTATPTIAPSPTSSDNIGLSIPIATPTPTPVIFNNLSAVIPNLVSNTLYDIRITVTDPDGLVGSNVVTGQMMTGESLSAISTITATPTTCNSYSSVGSVAWINSDLAKLSDGKFAGVPLATSSGTLTSHALACLGFGFNIPTTATIKGIKVSIKRAKDRTSGSASDAVVRLVKNGTPSMADRAIATEYNQGITIDEHGGASDLWGENWIPSQINGNFGVVFAAKGNVSVGVDSIGVTVYYTQ
jgi:subtilisin family serine protease